MRVRKYPIPEFINEFSVTQEKYDAWLSRKASAHLKRDKKRLGSLTDSVSAYKQRIHSAVEASNGLDYYTGEKLGWHLIGKWRNEEAKDKSAKQKKKFNRLPTVDHFSQKKGDNRFVICSWQINDMKNDNEYIEFLELCEKVLKYAEVKKKLADRSGASKVKA